MVDLDDVGVLKSSQHCALPLGVLDGQLTARNFLFFNRFYDYVLKSRISKNGGIVSVEPYLFGFKVLGLRQVNHGRCLPADELARLTWLVQLLDERDWRWTVN